MICLINIDKLKNFKRIEFTRDEKMLSLIMKSAGDYYYMNWFIPNKENFKYVEKEFFNTIQGLSKKLNKEIAVNIEMGFDRKSYVYRRFIP